MRKLTRDGTAEPVSRDQILRHERGQRINHFPCSAADHEQDWQPCPVVRAIHTNIVLHKTYRCSYTYICAYYTTTVNLVHTKKQQYWVPVNIYVLTTDTADHEQVWQPYAVDPYYSAISKWWPYLLAPYIDTDHQQY